MKIWPTLTLGLLVPFNALANSPFEACPAEAFIIQSPAKVPILYAVNLGTGSYSSLSDDMGITNTYNGVGFSYRDNYLYGWDYEHKTLGQAGDDYQIVPLNVLKDSESQAAGNFYIGDVAINENTWYGYRKGKGLFSIPLDSKDYKMSIVPGSKSYATYTITDFAFHPTNGFLYAVSNGSTGNLLMIDPATGESTNLGTVLSSSGRNFTFGAQFFDPQGNLYVSNNGDGNVYRVMVDSDTPVGELFSYGPSSSTNDGARCALADIPVGDNVDFGDAPDSYGTSIENNGARHQIDGKLYLGTRVDNESDAYLPPLSDDNSQPDNDEDGVSMVTGFELGDTATLLISVTGSGGFVNGWFDWNQNGEFDLDEQAISGQSVNAGENIITIQVPIWAQPGDTWARFRISSNQDIGANGGVSDGEVEDYPVTITETGVSVNYYPSSSNFTSIAYEDLYPDQGDFDMNDVVMHLRIAEYTKNDQVYAVGFEANLAAMGAAYHNGFAMQLPNVARSNVNESKIRWTQQGKTQTSSPLETQQSNAVLIFSQDLWEQIAVSDNCLYFRTEPGCGTQYRTTWTMFVPFNQPIDKSSMPSFPYDPFIFATPGLDHGLAAKNIAGGNPGRKLEIHLKNQTPTDKFEQGYFGSRDDASTPNEGQTFQDSNGMSWAIEAPVNWQHPAENQRLDEAYVDFIHFAADKQGKTAPQWYLTPNLSLVFDD